MPDVVTFRGSDNGERPPLVGREDELQQLLDAVLASGEGRPTAVLIGGDAGVGKTRLLGQLLEELAPTTLVLRGGCVDLGDVGLPYLPFVEAIGDLARLVPAVADIPGLGPLLPQGGGSGGDLVRLQLFEAVVAALRAAGEVASVVLVLEDLHWADASSRELLRFLLTRVRSERVTVLASYRTDDLHRRHPLVPFIAEVGRLANVRHLLLRPLGEGSLLQHLRVLAPSGTPASLLSAVAVRAEGNAYFAEELLLAALDAGDLEGRVLPHRLSEVLLSRLERLDESTLGVVRLAAVAGRRVEHELLAAAGVASETALRDAVAAQVLVVTPGASAGSYSFRHALLQETVYDDLLPGERVRMHGLIAQVLADHGGTVGERAFHRERSGDLPGALEDYLLAGAAALARGAPHEALALRERALELVEAGTSSSVPRAELLRMCAEAAGFAGDWGRAIALARARVVALSSASEAEQSSARQALALHLLEADRELDALEEASSARALATATGDPAVIARAESLYARAIWRKLDEDGEVRAAAERALDAAVAADLTEVQADALVTLGALAESEGDVDTALGHFRRARDLAAAHGHLASELRAGYNIAAQIFYAGDLAAAEDAAAVAVARAEELGLRWSAYGYSVRGLQSVIRYSLGDFDGAVTAATTSLGGAADPTRESLAAIGLYVDVARGVKGATDRALSVVATEGLDPMSRMIASGVASDALRMEGQAAAASRVAEEGWERIARVWGEYSLGGIWLGA
ncbi:MAG: LuxR family transcriptional regulator, partial [Frankiales bacterium]|nr:LuxR family transcriptional regulator [Frankiales bacterium]